LGRIDEDVWQSWKGGMDYYWHKLAKIKEFFLEQSKFNESYNRLFEELMIAE